MRTYIVTEGKGDVKLLQRIIPEEWQSNVTWVPASGAYAVVSIARSLLAARQSPVAVVMDADTSDNAYLQTRTSELEDSLRDVAGMIPFCVVLVKPRLEAVFFEARSFLENRFPGHSEHMRKEWLARPIETLATLGNGDGQILQIVDSLTSEEIESLRQTGPMRRLIDFLEENAADRPKETSRRQIVLDK